MYRLVIVLSIAGVLLTSVFAFQSVVHAETTLSDTHIERVRQNCVVAQTVLRQLHAADGLTRNKLGKLYENTSTKLMAPLNSRIAYYLYGGVNLGPTAFEFERHFKIFRDDYVDYERLMTKITEINCVEKPVEFYEQVQSAREKRQRVYEDTQSLMTLLEAYQGEFESFAKDFEGDKQ